jgi:hypothetical protein
MALVFSMNCDATPFVDACGHTISQSGVVNLNTTTKAAGTGSAYFNGGYLSTPYSADLQFGTGSFTIDFWFKAGINDTGVINNTPNLEINSIPGFAIQTENTQGYGYGIRFDMSDGSHKFYAGSAPHWDYSTTVNQWNHVAFVADRSNQLLSIYGNNVLAATKSISTIGSITNSNGIRIGQRLDGWGFYYGYLDEINIYNSAVYPISTAKNSGLFFLHG